MPPSTKPTLTRGHEKPRTRGSLGSQARRASRNVLLLAVAVKLLDTGTGTLAHDAWIGLAEIVVGVGCLAVYELTD